MALEVLVELYQTLEEPDYDSLVRCYVYLNDPTSVVKIMTHLLTEEVRMTLPDSSFLLSSKINV